MIDALIFIQIWAKLKKTAKIITVYSMCIHHTDSCLACKYSWGCTDSGVNINLVKSAIVEHQTIRHPPNNLFEIVYDNGLSTKKVSYYPIRSEVSRISIRFNVQQTVFIHCILWSLVELILHCIILKKYTNSFDVME